MSTPANVKKLFAEDDNPRIIYSGDWATVSPIKPLEYGNTAHVTTQQGASATFRFQGTGVLFYITLPPVTGSRQARVDLIIKLDDEVISYQEDAPSIDKAIGKTPFSRQDLDPSRVHELVITNRGAPGFGDPAPLRLDGIEWRIPAASADVVPAQASPTTPPPSSTPSPLPEPGPSTTTPPPNSSPSPTAPLIEPQVSSDSVISSQDSESTAESSVVSEFTEAGSTISQERTITKVLPQDRVVTLTDSTGGITVQTGATLPPPLSAPQLSTGSIIGIVVAILSLLSLVGLLVLVLARRRRKARKNKTHVIADAEAQEEYHGSATPVIYPFTAHSYSPSSESMPSSNAGYPSTGHRSEKSAVTLTADSRRAAVGAHGMDLPPPAYDDRNSNAPTI